MDNFDILMAGKSDIYNKVSFDIEHSTVQVKLTEVGENILNNVNEGTYSKNEDGYYEIFTKDLFTLYGWLLASAGTGEISDIVKEPIKISEVYLKKENGISIRNK